MEIYRINVPFKGLELLEDKLRGCLHGVIADFDPQSSVLVS